MTIEHYERTQEQNDDLGITDMKTENYEKSWHRLETDVLTWFWLSWVEVLLSSQEYFSHIEQLPANT